MATTDTMMSLAPAAVEAWSAVATAVTAAVGAGFLIWDRFRPRPLELLGRMELRATVLPDAARCDVYLSSETGELLTLVLVQAPFGFEIASARNMTSIAMRSLEPSDVKWSDRLRYSRRITKEQDPEEAVVRLFIREAPKGFWSRLWHWRQSRRSIRIVGKMPYRRRARFTFSAQQSAHPNLRIAVKANTNKRARKTPVPASA